MDLSFRVSGPLISLPVDVGSTVKKGDVIAAIDPRDFQAALDSAQGNLSRAQANLLAMERGARPEEIEQLKAAVAEAEATYRQAIAEHERNAKLVPTRSGQPVGLRHEPCAAGPHGRTGQEGPGGSEYRREGSRPEDLEAKRAEIKALEAAVENAKNQLDYAMLEGAVRRHRGGQVRRQLSDRPGQAADRSAAGCLEDRGDHPGAGEPDLAGAPREEGGLPLRRLSRTRSSSARSRRSAARPRRPPAPIRSRSKSDQPEDVQILPGMAATVRGQPEEDGDGGGPGPRRAAQRRLHRRRRANRATSGSWTKAARRSRGGR